MVANANLALAIALPVGIVALLVALIFAAWLAGRRRRDRTDPLGSTAAAIYPTTHHALYGKSTSGSAATTTTATTTSNTATDVSDAASGEGDIAASTKSSRNPFKDITRSHSRSAKRNSYAQDSLWDVELDEVLDDRDWAPLEAGWREPKLQRQQQQWQHAQMRRAQSNGGYSARPHRDGRSADMPGTSSRMSSSERMVFGLAPDQAASSSHLPPTPRSHSGRNSFAHSGSHSGTATGYSSRNGSRPPPNTNGNPTSRGPGSVHGGASSSTLRSLGTVPEVPTKSDADSVHLKRSLEDTTPSSTIDVPSESGELEEPQVATATAKTAKTIQATETTETAKATQASGAPGNTISIIDASNALGINRGSSLAHPEPR